MSGQDETFMAVALECAALGLGVVEPNPMVGAVIVRDGLEIARGHHKKFGGPHAEIEAMRNFGFRISPLRASAGTDFGLATMYVTLEPCCHRNKKTPPCTEALIASGISRVVVAMEDPDANVRGRGIAALRAAGVEVTVGVCEAAARKLLAAYIKLRTLGRPWVIAKWAQTADGYLALQGPLTSVRGSPEAERPLTSVRGSRRWISNELSRAHAHRVRGVCDGIVVGIGTVLADDPMLTVRKRGHSTFPGGTPSGEQAWADKPGDGLSEDSHAGKVESPLFRQPLRVVLDCDLRIPLTSRLVQTVREFPLAIVASPEGLERNRAKARVLQEAGAEVVAVGQRAPGRLDLEKLLDEMGRRQWTRVLIEGGPAVLRDALELGLADEVTVYISPLRVGTVAEDLPRLDIAELAHKLPMTMEEERSFGDDRWVRYCRYNDHREWRE